MMTTTTMMMVIMINNNNNFRATNLRRLWENFDEFPRLFDINFSGVCRFDFLNDFIVRHFELSQPDVNGHALSHVYEVDLKIDR